jgi:hypothetical protein
MKSLIITGPEALAYLNTKPGVWPAQPIDPAKPWKCQHRVPVRPQPTRGMALAESGGLRWLEAGAFDWERYDPCGTEWLSPLGQPGDRVCCKETWAIYDLFMRPDTFNENDEEIWLYHGSPTKDNADHIIYRADLTNPNRLRGGWRSPTHMPAWASRLTLQIKAVGVVRVQEIDEAGAEAEGYRGEWRAFKDCYIPPGPLDPADHYWASARTTFSESWDSRWAKRGLGWEQNPWVFNYQMGRV